MKADQFILVGIEAPGIVNIYRHGVVNLSTISNEKALQLYNDGCKYLTPAQGSNLCSVKTEKISLKDEPKTVITKKAGRNASKKSP